MIASVDGSSSASAADRRRRQRPQGRRLEHLLCLDGPFEDLVGGDSRTATELRSDVAAQERVGGLLVQHARLPVVGHVRRVEVAHALAAEVEHLAVGKRPGRPVGEVVHRHHRSPTRRGPPASGVLRRAIRSSTPHSSDSTWPNVIQRRLVDREDRAHRLGHEREHLARAGVEQQRLVGRRSGTG